MNERNYEKSYSSENFSVRNFLKTPVNYDLVLLAVLNRLEELLFTNDSKRKDELESELKSFIDNLNNR